MITARADVVGSLLRPPELLRARADRAAGRITEAELRTVEDAAVDAAIRLQEEAGLEVVTDGEMRRLSFQSRMTEAVDGFGGNDLDAFLWGEWRGDPEVGDWSLERPKSLGVVGKLTRRRHLSVDEFTYLAAHTTRTPKITLPSPSLFANFWSPETSRGVYPTLEAFLADVVDILRAEVAELVRRGALYIQLDAPHYALLLDDRTRAFYETRGWSRARWLAEGIAMDNGDRRSSGRHLRLPRLPGEPGKPLAHRRCVRPDGARDLPRHPCRAPPPRVRRRALRLVRRTRGGPGGQDSGPRPRHDEVVADGDRRVPRGARQRRQSLRAPRSPGGEPAVRLLDVGHRQPALGRGSAPQAGDRSAGGEGD